MSALKKIEERYPYDSQIPAHSDLKKLARALDHALEWLRELGCDCGVDESGTCGLCVAERTLEEVAGD